MINYNPQNQYWQEYSNWLYELWLRLTGVDRTFRCQAYYEESPKCDQQCEHCKQYYAPLEKQYTHRNFPYYNFVDRNGIACSIQKSSLAFENAIWLGADKIELKEFISGKGWVDRNEFDDIDSIEHHFSANTRMHLTQDQVKKLLPLLQKFADIGEI